MVCCKKGGAKVVVRERNGEELNQVESFRYLASVICESGGCEKDVQVRVSASWMKWKEVSAVMNDRDETKGKDVQNCGQTSDDIWVRVLGVEEKGWEETEDNGDEDVEEDAGCDFEGQNEKWGCEGENNSDIECGVGDRG